MIFTKIGYGSITAQDILERTRELDALEVQKFAAQLYAVRALLNHSHDGFPYELAFHPNSFLQKVVISQRGDVVFHFSINRDTNWFVRRVDALSDVVSELRTLQEWMSN